ncbi:MAG: cell division protein FtsZ [Candidatus Babeliales bacterium]
MIELSIMEDENRYKFGASIKVIGVGGAGSNAVNSMVSSQEFQAVEFMVANTDQQALEQSPTPCKIQLGAKITKGLGAGSNPDLGRRAAEEDLETVSEKIRDTEILFLTAGLGGGTGTGALPVIASAAKELGILTVVVVTKPFLFEGKRRLKYAEETIEQLRASVDTLIVVPNQRLLEISDPKISMLDAFAKSNEILKQAIKGISDIITKPGHINVDFADVRAIMKEAGMAVMGTGSASGPNRAEEAALAAINSPLIENSSITGAKGILINITGNIDLGLHEISQATTLISQNASEDANIILGSAIDSSLKDEIVITVIATGFQRSAQKVDIKSNMSETFAKPAMSDASQIMASKADSSMSNINGSTKEADEIKIDLNDFDTPAFMRKKAARDLSSENNLE